MQTVELIEDRRVWATYVEVEEYYTVHNAARILNVTPTVVYNWLKAGKFRGVKVDGTVMIPHDELVRQVAKRGEPKIEPYIPETNTVIIDERAKESA